MVAALRVPFPLFPDLTLDAFGVYPVLTRTELVVRVLLGVLDEGHFCSHVPNLAFGVRKATPGDTDDLGERAVARLDLCADVTILDEGGTEEDERVGRAGDVVIGFFLVVARTTVIRTV